MSDQFQEAVGRWADQVFPHSTLKSILAHLQEEVEEELNESASPDEAADVLLLLLHYAHKRQFDLFEEAKRKFDINRGRRWSKPDVSGISRHLEDA